MTKALKGRSGFYYLVVLHMNILAGVMECRVDETKRDVRIGDLFYAAIFLLVCFDGIDVRSR
jgi:hypothetical protein